MEIAGEIKSKHVDQIRLITSDKKQEIDVFYTDSMKFDVENLSVSQMVVFEVRLQSIDYFSLKLGKFWLKQVLIPARPPNKSSRHQKGEYNWAQNTIRENKEREENKFEEYPD